MSAKLKHLVRQLHAAGLASGDQTDDVLITSPSSVDDFLSAMERKQYLTSYQSGRIRKGQIDELTIGEYKLLYRNASGSFARVFRAASLRDNRMVALKLLRARWAKEPDFVQNFYREASVCRRFDHPNIVPIYDVGEDGGRHFFTMEFVEGGNLRDFIRIRKKLSASEGAKCLIDICRGLDYAVQKGVSHRDLKMTNVLMSSTGVGKLVDFGLAGDDNNAGGQVDDGNQRALEYASLEKGTNAPRNDPRSDIFFAGAILYELIAGQPAWPSTRNRQERKQFGRYFNVRPLSQLDPSLPKSVTEVVARMMEPTPDSRYQTPGEVVTALEAALVEIDGSSAASGKPAANKSSKQQAQKATVLCVENRPKQQKILREYFNSRGYRLLLISNYESARTRLQSENRPDCMVVMDTVANGSLHEVFTDMQQIENSTRVPSLIIMNKARAAELEQAGVMIDRRRVLLKPVNLKQLRMTIDKAVQPRA